MLCVRNDYSYKNLAALNTRENPLICRCIDIEKVINLFDGITEKKQLERTRFVGKAGMTLHNTERSGTLMVNLFV